MAHVGQNEDEKSFLQLANSRACRSGQNEELYRRLGMGLSLDAAK